MSLSSGFNWPMSPSTIALPAVGSNKIIRYLFPSVTTKPITSLLAAAGLNSELTARFSFLPTNMSLCFSLFWVTSSQSRAFCIFHLHNFLLIFYWCVSLPLSPTILTSSFRIHSFMNRGLNFLYKRVLWSLLVKRVLCSLLIKIGCLLFHKRL